MKMNGSNVRLGILLMCMAALIFAFQDGISKHLSVEYNPLMVVMIRYWFFGAFVLVLYSGRKGGLPAVARTRQPLLQIFRGVLLASEIFVMMIAIVLIGLVESLAIFFSNPLLVAALSGVVLGEHVGWRRWLAIAVGFVGVVIIINPGAGVFEPGSLLAFLSASMFALYVILTRYAARRDTAETSFFWTGVGGAAAATVIGIWFWESMSAGDWALMAILCVMGASGHFLLIRCYGVCEASKVQPFSYLHLVFASLIGLLVFDEDLALHVVIGCAIVVATGLFTLWRERKAIAASSLRAGGRRSA